MSVANEVWKIIQADLAMQKDLSRGLINHRALARFIMDKYGLDASLDGVISAVRRFAEEGTGKASEKKLESIFKKSAITTRNNLICFTLKADGINLLHKVAHKGVRFVTGTKTIKLIADESVETEVEPVFSDYIIKIEEDLSEIAIAIKAEAAKTRGVMARIANEISMNEINIEELLISPPEFLIYVKQKDAIKTLDALLKLSKS